MEDKTKNELIEGLSDTFVKKCDLEDMKKQEQKNMVDEIDKPCNDTENCSLHSKIDEIKKQALVKGLAIGKVTNTK